MKPGYKTTEFWITILSGMLPLLVVSGVLSPDEAAGVEAGLPEALETVVAVVGYIVLAIRYVSSRTAVKTSGAA